MTKSEKPAQGAANPHLASFLDLLRCPQSGHALSLGENKLKTIDGAVSYAVTDRGICLFAEKYCSTEAKIQQSHYDRIAQAYMENLAYPHTQEYMAYLDKELLDLVTRSALGTVAEICCGRGEAIALLADEIGRGIGVDISTAMLEHARGEHPQDKFLFVQGDATTLPLADAAFDSVFMLGGIHHVSDRRRLFSEVARILKPGGRFYFREPVSDFIVWRALRAIIYRISPQLDHNTERPLLYRETVPVLEEVGLRSRVWRTCGFIGFCLLMNSDVLIFNRLFRLIPGIRGFARLFARLDKWTTSLPGVTRAGLQVVGVAEKPDRIGS
jgi:ubiquinone/menaquinone biosynthesis C-methylase UbiE